MDAKATQRPHPWRWVAAAAIILLLLLLGKALYDSQIIWELIPQFAFSQTMLDGLWGTVVLTIAVMALAIIIGVLVAVASQSPNFILRWFAAGWIWVMRGIPALVHLLLWFNLALIIPYVGFGSAVVPTNSIMTPFIAALIGLTLSESAVMAEIVRSGIMSVPLGQVEAGKAMGMRGSLTMRRIILPQAIRVIIPPTGNEVIGMLKYTSLAFAVSYSDLLSAASKIYNANFKVMEALFAATFWYLVLTTIATLIQNQIARRYELANPANIAAASTKTGGAE
ncbi:amino acid ABC transporter permease [Microbacterium sp.]|uniref:amino acid ABC transporter permease n=1 Tax=Microbacterium sp. TaxID=51671 RepID=UPI0035B2C4BB